MITNQPQIMKTHLSLSKPSLFFTILVLLLIMGCQQMSEQISDKSAGLNGGFEISKNDLPVNWLLYTPKTVPDSDFKIVLDKDVFKEGKQSLKFDVQKCSSTGGWHSPGFTNEFSTSSKYEGEGSYKLSFWIKNDGSKFNVSAGGVSAMKGNMKTLIQEDMQINDWKLLEYEIDIPEKNWLRMQLNILQPGTFWIDDVRVEKNN